MAKMGRPTKYTDEVIEKLADELLDWFADEENMFIKGFFVHKKIPSENSSRFAEQNEYFSQALKMAKDIQEQRIALGGLTGKYNCTFAIFTLKNVAEWRDRQDQHITAEVKNSHEYHIIQEKLKEDPESREALKHLYRRSKALEGAGVD